MRPRSAGAAQGRRIWRRPRAIMAKVVTVRAPARLEADGVVTAVIYDDERATLPSSGRASFVPAASPDAPVPVRLADGASQVWSGATSRVDFHVEGAPLGIAPGAAGWV